MYQNIFRHLFFRLKPEQAHDLTIQILRFVGLVPPIYAIFDRYFNAYSQCSTPLKTIKISNVKFPNPIGLAAGYDKDALAWRGLTTLGFGHIEVGTVTPQPQSGNPKPRVFRIPEEDAIINRMGFPGRGADFVARQLSLGNRQRKSIIIGVNIGKNKDTPNEEAARDYLYLLEKFSPLADYLAINVSSPNTIGLRRLQAREILEDLLNQLAAKRSALSVSRPILVKLAPDLSDDELDDALAAVSGAGMDGVVATNTTIDRTGLRSVLGQEIGGLSGAPLSGKSLGVVEKIHSKTAGRLPVVGVGGIMNSDDAKAMLDAGASLIQLYTGMIYAGPGLVKNIVRAL